MSEQNHAREIERTFGLFLSWMPAVKKEFINARVLSNNGIYPLHYLIELEVPSGVDSQPGQFLELHLRDKNQFLRKPFSIFDQESNRLKILYKIRGFVTDKLSMLNEGDVVDIIYPLGEGFPESKGNKALFVAGGSGFAPLYFLAKRYLKNSDVEIKFLIGSSGAEAEKFGVFLKTLGLKVLIATEDGTAGRKGTVMHLLEGIKGIKDYIIYSAGPVDMLKAVYSFSHLKGIETYFSLESHFACGLGFCWGCAIETRNGFLRVCKEGPVFEGESVLWEKI